MSKAESPTANLKSPRSPEPFHLSNGETARDVIERLFPQNGTPIQIPSSLNQLALTTEAPPQAILVNPSEVLDNGHSDEQSTEENEASLETPLAIYIRDITRIPLLTAEQEIQYAKELERGKEAQKLLLESASGIDRDSLEETARLGEGARKRLTESNLRLVVSVARKYMGRGLPLLDMIQEGNIGLQRGVEKYEWRRGFRFSTYAYWWIRQAVTRAIADQGRTIRIPVHAVEQLNELSRAEQILEQDLGREPTDEELARKVKFSLERVQGLERARQFPASLEYRVGEGEDTLSDLVPDPSLSSLEEGAEKSELHDKVEEALTLAGLSPQEINVIRLRFGLDGSNIQLSLAEVGKEIGLSRERVRQIERDALGKLKNPLVRQVLRYYI